MPQEIKKTVGIYTLGCKVNQYESEAVAEKFEAEGFSVLMPDGYEKCDIYVINTCTVTAESDRKARQIIRRAEAKNPDAYILVTGCVAQSSPRAIADIGGVDYICGSDRKLSVVDAAKALIARGEKNAVAEINVGDIEAKTTAFEPMTIKKFERTRAYVKIEDGCRSKCAYCAIPAARGIIRSKPRDELLCEIASLVKGGCREVVLTGIETASYGIDFLQRYRLADLLCDIDAMPEVADGGCIIRLGSLDPALITEEFAAKIAPLKSLAPHFHLSLQSGSDRILKLMRRKYLSDRAYEGIERLKRLIPGVMFTTDMIVGFPTETEEDFAASEEFVRRAGFLMVHVFAYSKRDGTPAAEMEGQVPPQIKSERSARLSKTASQVRGEILSQMTGKTVNALFECRKGEYFTGHTPSFMEVKLKTKENLHSEVKAVTVIGNDGDALLAVTEN